MAHRVGHRVALIHTSRHAVKPTELAMRQAWPSVDIAHFVDTSLALDLDDAWIRSNNHADAERAARQLREEALALAPRLQHLLEHARRSGCRGALLTCGALGGALDGVRLGLAEGAAEFPVVRPAEAALRRALRAAAGLGSLGGDATTPFSGAAGAVAPQRLGWDGKPGAPGDARVVALLCASEAGMAAAVREAAALLPALQEEGQAGRQGGEGGDLAEVEIAARFVPNVAALLEAGEAEASAEQLGRAAWRFAEALGGEGRVAALLLPSYSASDSARGRVSELLALRGMGELPVLGAAAAACEQLRSLMQVHKGSLL